MGRGEGGGEGGGEGRRRGGKEGVEERGGRGGGGSMTGVVQYIYLTDKRNSHLCSNC